MNGKIRVRDQNSNPLIQTVASAHLHHEHTRLSTARCGHIDISGKLVQQYYCAFHAMSLPAKSYPTFALIHFI